MLAPRRLDTFGAICDIGSDNIFEYLLIFGSTLLVAWCVLRLGRWLLPNSPGLSYLFSAYGAVVVGICVAWGYNRWLRLTPGEREASDFSPVVKEVWEFATQPKFGEQFLPLAMTGGLIFFCLVSCARRWAGTWWGGLGVWLVAWGLFCALMYLLLATSIYMFPSESLGSRIGNVVIPGFALSLGWLGAWLRQRQSRTGWLTWMVASMSKPASDSRIYFLAVMAVACSAAILLATSGTLTLATRGLMIAMIPLAWSMETWCTGQLWKTGLKNAGKTLPVQAAESVGIWLPASSGLLVVLGVYFGSTSTGLAALFALSLLLLPWLWPLENASWHQRWVRPLIAACPALLAASISAFLMLRELM